MRYDGEVIIGDDEFQKRYTEACFIGTRKASEGITENQELFLVDILFGQFLLGTPVIQKGTEEGDLVKHMMQYVGFRTDTFNVVMLGFWFSRIDRKWAVNKIGECTRFYQTKGANNLRSSFLDLMKEEYA